MDKLEHIGIAVKDLADSNKLFAKLLGREHYKIEEVTSEGVRTSFFDMGNVKIELLEATRPDSPIAAFIEKRGEGIHHLAFEVGDIKKGITDYTEKGFSVLQPAPKAGADNKLICFLHPKETNGVLDRTLSISTAVDNLKLIGETRSPTTGMRLSALI